MTTDAAIVVQGELEQGETLLWAGPARRGLKLVPVDAFLIPFTAIWLGLVILWEVIVLTNGAPWYFLLIVIPFFLVGVYMLVGRFVIDARQRESTYYGVTDKRVVIVSGEGKKKVQALDLATLSDVSMNENDKGGGTITFGTERPGPWWLMRGAWPGLAPRTPLRFELETDIRRVFSLISDARRPI